MAAIRKRANNTTPGPWEYVDDYFGVRQVPTEAHRTGRTEYEVEGIIPGEHIRVNDAVFIAHARTDVPALLDHVDTLAAQLAAVRELHQEHGCDSVLLGCSIIVTGECSRVGTCEHCRRLYPCPTIQAIEGDQ